MELLRCVEALVVYLVTRGEMAMAETFAYRTINIHQGGDTFYVLQKESDDSEMRPNGHFAGQGDSRLALYLATIGQDGWEVCAHLTGVSGAFSTLLLKKRI